LSSSDGGCLRCANTVNVTRFIDWIDYRAHSRTARAAARCQTTISLRMPRDGGMIVTLSLHP